MPHPHPELTSSHTPLPYITTWCRQGISSALISSAAIYLQGLYPAYLRIDVKTSNLAAEKAYAKLGFRVVNEFEG